MAKAKNKAFIVEYTKTKHWWGFGEPFYSQVEILGETKDDEGDIKYLVKKENGEIVEVWENNLFKPICQKKKKN